VILQRSGGKGTRLGTLVERAAAGHPANLVILDHDLDIAPRPGRRATLTELADLIDDFASRLRAARVRPGRRVVVHEADGFDIPLLARHLLDTSRCSPNRLPDAAATNYETGGLAMTGVDPVALGDSDTIARTVLAPRPVAHVPADVRRHVIDGTATETYGTEVIT
jgi:hypothetical protein